jgi:hypothetical protein
MKNAILLNLMFSLQQNWRREQNKLCLEVRGVERGGGEWTVEGRDGPNNVYTYE